MLKKITQLLNRKKDAEQKLSRWAFGTMFVSGALALLAAFTLTVEKFHLYENPDAILSCSFNVVLNCSTVMQTWQASVFGFPNMVFGLIAFSVVATVSLIGFIGIKFPRWFLLVAQAGYLLGALFAYWLFFQSLYNIQALCPWCLVVTFTSTLIFASLLYYNLRNNIFNLSKKYDQKVQAFLNAGLFQLAIASWFVIMIALVFLKFGDSLFA